MDEASYGAPLLISDTGETAVLERISLGDSSAVYNEEFIQNLVFRHPEAIPIREIDLAYTDLVPICCELSTPAGYLDILLVTKTGKLCIVEAKLWRNPESRRKVVGQILDYAQELAGWSYEDLQRQVSKTTGVKGNVLYDLVKEKHPEIIEAEFIDSVSRSLSKGEFLLLILGDGIREGVSAIAEYIDNSGNLDFTFGLVEVAIYRQASGDILFQPRVLARAEVFRRSIIELRDDRLVINPDENNAGTELDNETPKELSERQQFYTSFWSEFVQQLKLDDPSQPMGKTPKAENFYLTMPLPSGNSWVSAYFARSKSLVGVYLTFTRGSMGDLAYNELLKQQEAITGELGSDVLWESVGGKHTVFIRKNITDPWADEYKEEISEFFSDYLNRFVNAFRPRLADISNTL